MKIEIKLNDRDGSWTRSLEWDVPGMGFRDSLWVDLVAAVDGFAKDRETAIDQNCHITAKGK